MPPLHISHYLIHFLIKVFLPLESGSVYPHIFPYPDLNGMFWIQIQNTDFVPPEFISIFDTIENKFLDALVDILPLESGLSLFNTLLEKIVSPLGSGSVYPHIFPYPGLNEMFLPDPGA